MADVYSDVYADAYGDFLASGADGFRVLIDWDADGDFLDRIDDVTADLRPTRSPVALEYGRETGGEAPTTAGAGSMVLDNRDRKYWSRNTSSPIYGKPRTLRPVRVSRTIGGVERILFQGRTAYESSNPDVSSQQVTVSLLDYLADFRGQDIATGLYQGITTGQAIGLVLDAVGWSATARDLDQGATIIPWWWESDTDALTALDKIVRSEGFPAFVTVGGDGQIIFRDRYHRRTRTASTISQATWRPAGQPPVILANGFAYDDNLDRVVNRAAVQIDTRTVQPETEIWAQEGHLVMGAYETQSMIISSSDPFRNARVIAESSVDRPLQKDREVWAQVMPRIQYTATLSRTSGTSAILTMTTQSVAVPGSRIVFPALRVVAEPVPVTSSTIVSAENGTSQTKYGVRKPSGSLDLPWCGINDAEAIVTQLVADRAEPLPTVGARFLIGNDDTAAAGLLTRDLSDRVTIIEPESGLNEPFHIERIRHDFTSEMDHEIEFVAERVPPTSTTPFLIGTSLIGTGTLG